MVTAVRRLKSFMERRKKKNKKGRAFTRPLIMIFIRQKYCFKPQLFPCILKVPRGREFDMMMTHLGSAVSFREERAMDREPERLGDVFLSL